MTFPQNGYEKKYTQMKIHIIIAESLRCFFTWLQCSNQRRLLRSIRLTILAYGTRNRQISIFDIANCVISNLFIVQYVSSHEFIFSFPVSLSRSQQVFFSFNYFMFFMCHFFAYIKREKKAHIKVSGRHTQKSQLHSLVLLRTENGEGKGEKKKIEAKHVKTYVWKVFANNRTATNTLEIFARTRAISSITWNKSFADFPIFFSLSLHSFDEIIKKKSQNTSFSVHTQPKLFYDYTHRDW